MARVLKSDDGKKIMVLDAGFVASYEGGKWVSGAKFDNHELSEQFRTVKNKAEAEALLSDARMAVKQLATA